MRPGGWHDDRYDARGGVGGERDGRGDGRDDCQRNREHRHQRRGMRGDRSCKGLSRRRNNILFLEQKCFFIVVVTLSVLLSAMTRTRDPSFSSPSPFFLFFLCCCCTFLDITQKPRDASLTTNFSHVRLLLFSYTLPHKSNNKVSKHFFSSQDGILTAGRGSGQSALPSCIGRLVTRRPGLNVAIPPCKSDEVYSPS